MKTECYQTETETEGSKKRVSFSLLRLIFICLAAVLAFVVLSNGRVTHYIKFHFMNESVLAVCTVDQMMQGVWRKRASVSSVHEVERDEKDEEIRRFRGLPEMLYRPDGRCGTRFLLNGTLIPSLCDAKSASPCCDDHTGMCGSGPKYCDCPHCKDSRAEISAELHEYVIPGCALKNYTSKEACEWLNRRISSLTLVGDSLVRHLHNAIMILLTNDQTEGALHKNTKGKQRQACAGEHQFVDSGKSMCHTATAFRAEDQHKHKFCEGRNVFKYSFMEGYNLKTGHLALTEVRKHLNKNNSIIAVGVGLHMNLEFEKVKQYMEPILKLKNESESEWPHLIWIATQAHGNLKPVQYLVSQSNENVRRYNNEMREFLQPYDIPVFDTFNATLGVKTYDGTHYGLGMNMVKAQLFMNFLWEHSKTLK